LKATPYDRSVKNYINSQLVLITFQLTAPGAQRYGSSRRRRRRRRTSTGLRREDDGRGKWSGELSPPIPGTRQVAAPARAGSAVPLPRRNLTLRSPPPPAAPGTRPAPGEHRFPSTIFSLGGHRPLGFQRPPRGRRSSRAPQPPRSSRGLPSPVIRRRTWAQPHVSGRTFGTAAPLRSRWPPLRTRAATPPSPRSGLDDAAAPP
jgi:hypothetical protein